MLTEEELKEIDRKVEDQKPYKPLKRGIEVNGVITMGLLSYGTIGTLLGATLATNPILSGVLIGGATLLTGTGYILYVEKYLENLSKKDLTRLREQLIAEKEAEKEGKAK